MGTILKEANRTLDYAIETESLGKHYGRSFAALDGVSLRIGKGEVVGYVGPNGAGKTTTIRILTGLTMPTSGRAYINGIDVTARPREALRSVGALIEVPGIYDYLTPRDMLAYFGRVYRMSRADIDRRIKETMDLVRLSDWEQKKIGSFSTGMQRRLAIAKALLHQPSILILDEPVLGLDPKGIRDVRELIKQFRSEGMTVFLSSHLLSEVAEVCSTVIFLDKGKVVSADSMASIGQKIAHTVVQVKFNKPLSAEETEKLKSVELINSVELNGSAARLHCDGRPETSYLLLRRLVSLGLEIVYYNPEGAGLEDYYVSVMGDEKGVK